MQIKQWEKLSYVDAKSVLMGLHDVATRLPLHELDYRLGSLRTNDTNHLREARQCALFCYGIGQALETEMQFARVEEQNSDRDFIVRYLKDGYLNYAPVQVKELVPQIVKTEVDLQAEIDKLQKYSTSQDLIVAFHLNRDMRIRLTELDFSRVPVAELWFFGGITPDQKQWHVIGNLLSVDAKKTDFFYPLDWRLSW